ncbi:MAG: DNA recombination protein RmuC [Desulfobulbaceae bacterium]|nr:DNA recombination protein RmuC [Desulfobulbaceae bacterium]
MPIIPWLSLLLATASLVVTLLILKKLAAPDDHAAQTEKTLREEFRLSREEATHSARELRAAIGADSRLGREEAANSARELRQEVATTQKATTETVLRIIGAMGKSQQERLVEVEAQIKALTAANRADLEKIRATLAGQLKELQEGNEKKLDQMRQTVDEKLQTTLEKRLGESFKLVSERLESVQRGLGEMQSLAAGVGDLKRVLTNVKARGTWGEVQLGAILEQVLTPEQYEKNVKTREHSQDMVEYAIKLPGSGATAEAVVWLPIDAKFPQEDYQRLLAAAEAADSEAVEKACASLTRAILLAAKDISSKYLNPPRTTDFAIMFLPTEGLYAEILRQPGLSEKLQHDFRVVVAGPTTLAATLSSLRMGFRTLAIEKRSSEVWEILSAVKTEFARFGEVLGKVKKQLVTAANTIDDTEVRTRKMASKLKSVEELPTAQAEKLLGLTETPGEKNGSDA